MPSLNAIRSRVLASPNVFLLVLWILGAALTVFVPVMKWNNQKNYYYNYVGRYNEYEIQQRQYEQQNNGEQQYNYEWYAASCSWYQFSCKKRAKQMYYYNRDNNRDENQIVLPDWYMFLGGVSEEEDREREERGLNADAATGAIKFVYSWSLLTFIALVGYGGWVMHKGQSPTILLVSLGIFLQMALISLVLLPQGVISTEGRQMEDSIYGWYGQMSVLMVYTDFAYILFSVILGGLVGAYAYVTRRNEATTDVAEAKGTSYTLA